MLGLLLAELSWVAIRYALGPLPSGRATSTIVPLDLALMPDDVDPDWQLPRLHENGITRWHSAGAT